MRALSQTHAQAKALRAAMTLPEVLLWSRIRPMDRRAPQIRRQHPVGPYILDFYCSKAKLAIEVDGASHDAGDGPARDARRDAFLTSRGLHVLRIPAKDVLRDPDEIAYSVLAAIRTRIDPPPRSGGGGAARSAVTEGALWAVETPPQSSGLRPAASSPAGGGAS